MRSGWDRLLLLLPFSTSPVFSMGGVFESCAVCSPVSFPSEAKKHKHGGERMKIKVTQRLHKAFLSDSFLKCLDATTVQYGCSVCVYISISYFARSSVGVLCSSICESAFMWSAACVCVCVFYKLALEPSGLIMWPGNYTGLSEKARAA